MHEMQIALGISNFRVRNLIVLDSKLKIRQPRICIACHQYNSSTNFFWWRWFYSFRLLCLGHIWLYCLKNKNTEKRRPPKQVLQSQQSVSLSCGFLVSAEDFRKIHSQQRVVALSSDWWSPKNSQSRMTWGFIYMDFLYHLGPFISAFHGSVTPHDSLNHHIGCYVQQSKVQLEPKLLS